VNRRQLLQTVAALPVAGAGFAAAATQQKQIKITGLETDLLKRPPGTPTYDAIHKLGVESGSVVLRLRTDAGITGWASVSYGMIAGGPAWCRPFWSKRSSPSLWDRIPHSRGASAPNYGKRWSTTVSAA